MFRLEFINSMNKRVELFSSPFRLIRVIGLGDVEADVSTQKAPYQDGTTFIDSTLRERFIEIEIKITGNDEGEVGRYRALLASIFNPKLKEGTLRYIGKNGIKQISVTSESIPFFPDGSTNRSRTFQKAVINLMAPNPYWQSTEQISEPMTAYIGLFKFPFTLPTQFGTVGSIQTFINDGDVETPVQIEFRGPATNPRITNKTTGEFIQVNRALLEDDRLVVDTTFGNKQVVIIDKQGNETNVLNWIDLNSTFWQLIPGENEIEYTADAGRENAIVAITWRNRYLGV